MNNKTFTVVVLVIILVIGGLLVYSVNKREKAGTPILIEVEGENEKIETTDEPTPSDTTTRTYKNTEYGIEFKYPVVYRNSTAERSSNFSIVTLETADHAIAVRSITPKAGQSYEQALIEDVILDPRGEHPDSFSDYKSRTINGKQYHWIVTSRFEGIISINYYLKRDNDILAFSSQSRNVSEWTNPEFNIDNDVAHKDLRTLLGTLKLSTPNGSSVKVYFVDTKSPDFQTSCGATKEITRSIPKTVAVADSALRELFKGPTSAEKSAGLEMRVKAADYIGVIIRDGVATVNFKSAALTYLNGAACMQESVKVPIEKTLKQFPNIKSVNYAINGEIFTEWDA